MLQRGEAGGAEEFTCRPGERQLPLSPDTGSNIRKDKQNQALWACPVHQLGGLAKVTAVVLMTRGSIPSVPSARCPPTRGPSLCQTLKPQRKTKQSLPYMAVAGIVSVCSSSAI